jgi:NAD-dependent deacetylase
MGSRVAIASLPGTAAEHDATLAIVNFDPTPHDEIAEYVFRRDVTEVLPELVDAVASVE